MFSRYRLLSVRFPTFIKAFVFLLYNFDFTNRDKLYKSYLWPIKLLRFSSGKSQGGSETSVGVCMPLIL